VRLKNRLPNKLLFISFIASKSIEKYNQRVMFPATTKGKISSGKIVVGDALIVLQTKQIEFSIPEKIRFLEEI